MKINGKQHYLWRALDHEGEVLECFVTKRRDRKAALTFLKKAMKRYGNPEVIVTDRLTSYRAATKIIGNQDRQETARWANNRAENSSAPIKYLKLLNQGLAQEVTVASNWCLINIKESSPLFIMLREPGPKETRSFEEGANIRTGDMHYLGNTNLDFEQLVDSLSVPMMVLDRDLKFTFVNDPYCKVVNRTPEDLLGIPIFEAFPDNPERVEAVRRKFLKALDGETVYMDEQPYSLEDAEGNIKEHVWQIIQTPYTDKDGNITHTIQRCEDITEKLALRKQNEVISAELDHRVRNMLSVVEAMAMLASSTAEDVDSFVDAFSGRLVSMSRNFSQISKSSWEGLSLRAILENELSQVVELDDDRLSLNGPQINLNIKATKDTSLVIHELVTNAAKHGCFSKSQGKLDVQWDITKDGITFVWSETGMSGVTPPTREGFGTQLLKMMPELKVERTYRDEGFLVNVSVSGTATASAVEQSSKANDSPMPVLPIAV